MRSGVRVTGIDANIDIFRELRMKSHDQRPGWRRVARMLRQSVDRQFATEGVYLNGRRWKALSPPYLHRKRSAGFAGGILTRTGKMSRSFRILSMTKHRLVFGSRMDRAVWHQEGHGNNPKRPIIRNTSRKVRRDINAVLDDYLTEGL